MFRVEPHQDQDAVQKRRVPFVISRVQDYIVRNQSRLMLNIEASVQETPSRLVLVAAIYALMTQFAPLWLAALCFVIGFADDLVMYWVRNRLRRRMRNREFVILALSNILGATGFAVFLASILVNAVDPIARITAFMIFMATLVELASPKAGRHAFAFLTLAPVWIAMNVSLALVIWNAGSSLPSTLTGFVVLGMVAVHTSMMFMENALRTRTLMQETLRANVANEQKGRFLSAISHEVRTPLHAVYGTAQLLQTTTDPDEIRRLALILQVAASDMKVIVDEVIEYSQITGGQSQLRPVPTDPIALAHHMADLFRANADEKGLPLWVEASDPTARFSVILDPVRVGQVLANLVANAIAVSGRRGVVIRLVLPDSSLAANLAPNLGASMIRFIVDDSGPNLPSGLHDKVFDGHDIQRCSDAALPVGAGMSLAIAKLLAEGMGGGLCASDAPGGGVRFTLGLPLQLAPRGQTATAPDLSQEAVVAKLRELPTKADLRPAISATANEPAQSTLAPPTPTATRPASAKTSLETLRGLRVLVVDDVAINREVLRALLERQGAEVHEAADGQQGLAQIDRMVFDLVLLDNMMPVMSGSAMLAALRGRTGPEARIVVIGISAGTLSEDRDAFVALGLDGFLSKPVSFADLTELVTTKLTPDRRRMGSVAAV